MTDTIATTHPQLLPEGGEFEALKTIEQRMLWLSTLMIHHANNVRPNPDKSKVGDIRPRRHRRPASLPRCIFTFCAPPTACW